MTSLQRFLNGETSITDILNGIWKESDLLPEFQDELTQATHTLATNVEELRNLHQVSQKLAHTESLRDILAVLNQHHLFAPAVLSECLLYEDVWRNAVPTVGKIYAYNHQTEEVEHEADIDLTPYKLSERFSRFHPQVEPVDQLPEVQQQRANEASHMAAFPLLNVGDWFGMLMVYDDHDWTADDLHTMQMVVNQLAIAIYNIHLRDSSSQATTVENARFKALASLAHELRSPLTSILGFTDTLLTEDIDWDPTSRRDFLNTINTEAHRLGDMIEQLMDFAMLEGSVFAIQIQPDDIAAILGEALPRLEMLSDQHELRISLPETLPAANVDRRRIIQVFANLVENAAKYSPAGTAITINFSVKEEYVEVCIKDEGSGIPEDQIESIFEPFKRGESHGSPGNGLGLSITRGIMEAHEGYIEVSDTSEAGTTICFGLPAVLN